jgi:[protein-PII] uridylyltransferase
MRDCGLLQAYVPEFAPLVHAVAPEAASDHTLDEHAIEALRIMDDLGHTRERTELAQRETLEQVERPDLLRLAILLHDAPAVSNAATGRLAGQVADRIGLKPADRQDLLFLLDNVRTLWTHAESRAFEDGAAVRELASAVGAAERLRMLYLMTYAHARAAGPLGWFAWRDAQLYELYQTLMVILVPEYKPFATTQYFVREFEELARREGLAEAAADFLPLVPDLYKTEVSPAEALAHLELVRRTRSRPAAITWTLEAQEATLWTCTSDVPARFSQIAAVLTCNGLDITSATAFTLKDGTVLDRFGVHMKGRPINPDPAFWRRLEEDLVLTIRGELDAAEAARRRAAGAATAEAVSSLRLVTTVHFDNRSSARFTIVDIATRDRPGLLFEIAGALSAMGLNIELARVRTRADLAQDVFFVTDARTGGRVTDEGRLKAVRERLLEVTAPARAAL